MFRKKTSFHKTKIIQIKNTSFQLKQFISNKKKEETIFKFNCILTKIIMIIETVPVVIGALGLVNKGLGKYVEKIPGNMYVEELQLNNREF